MGQGLDRVIEDDIEGCGTGSRGKGLGQGLGQVVADNIGIGAFSTGSAIEEATVDLLRGQG